MQGQLYTAFPAFSATIILLKKLSKDVIMMILNTFAVRLRKFMDTTLFPTTIIQHIMLYYRMDFFQMILSRCHNPNNIHFADRKKKLKKKWTKLFLNKD
jgi:hypothetical protein